eukprot:3889520-Alexandrium_andersonii.AAC.1
MASMHLAGPKSSAVSFWRCVLVMGVHPRVLSVRSPLCPSAPCTLKKGARLCQARLRAAVLRRGLCAA